MDLRPLLILDMARQAFEGREPPLAPQPPQPQQEQQGQQKVPRHGLTGPWLHRQGARPAPASAPAAAVAPAPPQVAGIAKLLKKEEEAEAGPSDAPPLRQSHTVGIRARAFLHACVVTTRMAQSEVVTSISLALRYEPPDITITGVLQRFQLDRAVP